MDGQRGEIEWRRMGQTEEVGEVDDEASEDRRGQMWCRE
jgi:hypothetical protein